MTLFNLCNPQSNPPTKQVTDQLQAGEPFPRSSQFLNGLRNSPCVTEPRCFD